MLPPPTTSRLIRFGTFKVNPKAREVHKNGVKLKLQDQPFQVLAMLLEHPGDLVTRDELRYRLWPDDTFVDFDQGIDKAVNKTREALGDSIEHPRYIETLPKRGYRFIAPVEVAVVATAPSGRAEAPPVGGPPLSISPAVARALFVMVQMAYLAMYAVAFRCLPALYRMRLPVPGRTIVVILVFLALCGAAMRLPLVSVVTCNCPDSARLFHRVFPGLLLLDLVWSATPLLLMYVLGEVVALLTVGLAFLPFSQRPLLASAYPPHGRRVATVGVFPTVDCWCNHPPLPS